MQELLVAFVDAMAPRLKKVSKYFVADPRLNGGSIFRIYRDVRFSKDKTPYKTNGGVQFRDARGKDAHAPGFYIQIGPKEVFFGGGIRLPPSDVLLAIHGAICDGGAAWRKVTTGAAFRKSFNGISGDQLTHPPRGFDADDPNFEDLKRKSFFAVRQGTEKLARIADIPDAVAEVMRESAPLMKFLCKATGAPF